MIFENLFDRNFNLCYYDNIIINLKSKSNILTYASKNHKILAPFFLKKRISFKL